MKKKSLSLLLTGLMLCTACCQQEAPILKPRLVVMTDICPADLEPDDMESAIHLMTYADQFEIEAIMTTVGWNCDPYPAEWSKYLTEVVDAYEQDLPNLMKRSEQHEFLPLDAENGQQSIGYWPSSDYISSRCMAGSSRAGIGVIGEGNDSEGSDFLIRLADEPDPRPIWVAAWGSGNTLAQAIWKVQQTRSPEELKNFLHKFRIYTITDQDMVYGMRMNRAYSSHQWLRREFAGDLLFIWDEGVWQEQCDLGKRHWTSIQKGIQGKGHLGRIYPNYKWGVEGDTPSFLHVLPNGLHDPDDPRQTGWGGRHYFGLCPDSLTQAWTAASIEERHYDIADKVYYYESSELNDFLARMQWADEGKGNRNPIVRINGIHSLSPIRLQVKAGETVHLDASGTTDPDGDKMIFSWRYELEGIEARYQSTFVHKPVIDFPVHRETPVGHQIHLIVEATDKGEIPLTAYARVILEVVE